MFRNYRLLVLQFELSRYLSETFSLVAFFTNGEGCGREGREEAAAVEE
jgi:hypothetical protein